MTGWAEPLLAKIKRLTKTYADSFWPSIAVNGKNIYAVWSERPTTPGDSDNEIFLIKSINGGTSWQTPLRLTSNSGESCYPRIAVYGASINVVWEDDTPGNREIYYVKSANGGASWQTPERLTNNLGDSRIPEIAAEGGNIYVAWQDVMSGNWEIYFKSQKK